MALRNCPDIATPRTDEKTSMRRAPRPSPRTSLRPRPPSTGLPLRIHRFDADEPHPADIYGLSRTRSTAPIRAYWKDVNPALPATKIRVLGPPPTSGTRDSLADLYLTKGCETDPAMKALKKTDEDKHKEICTKVREDGAFVEAGENDNLLVQKVSADPGTLGVPASPISRRMPTRSGRVSIAGSLRRHTISD